MAQFQRLNRMAGSFANDVELAFQIILIHLARSARDKHLADQRLYRDRCGRQSTIIGRHVSPAQQDLPFGVYGAFDFLLAGHP